MSEPRVSACSVCGLFHPHEKPFTNLVECVTALRQDRVRCLETIADLELGTCDWGGCDRLAVDNRYHDEDAPYPLPVCVQHSEPYALLERQNMEYRLYLEQRMNRLLAESHALGQSSKCDGCTEATQIWELLGDVVPVKGTSVPGHD